MAHKVIVPQKKLMSQSFLNSGTLIVSIDPVPDLDPEQESEVRTVTVQQHCSQLASRVGRALYLHRAIHTGRDTPPGTPTPGLERSQPTGHTHCFKGGERALKWKKTTVCHNVFQLLY